ncbi:YlaF family protein [Peribacillus sp. SCS-155]|uniref:YlaF family protein n=1 Tax=Peribacillus sedimenti TaxID=3115297 RepID=UPI003905F420
MSDIKWNLLFIALMAVASMIWTGIAISEKSVVGIIISLIALIYFMGMGFTQKKKMREKGKL